MRQAIDRQAVWTGAFTIAVFAVPLAIAATWAGSRNEAGLALWCNIGVLVAFVVGSGCAAWVQRTGYPIAHGVVTAVVTFAVLTSIGIVIALARGQSPHWFRQLFLLTLTMAMGVIGGLIGARLQASGATPRDRGASGGR